MAIKFTNSEIFEYCLKLSKKIDKDKYDSLFPIPMGGYPVAIELSRILNLPIVKELEEKSLIIDDLIDTGHTISKYNKWDKAVLCSKIKRKDIIAVDNFNDWIIFPWEQETTIENNLIRVLQYIGENPKREGLLDTPKRIVKSYDKLFEGYKQNPKDLLKVFDKETYDQFVLLKDIEMYSTCEHHFLPFYGKAHIAYIPNKKVIGVSKLARLLEVYSRRLQIQERIGEQITNFIMQNLKAQGAACIIEAQHFCMTSRGVEKQKSKMVTSSLKGIFLKNYKARQEFLNLIR